MGNFRVGLLIVFAFLTACMVEPTTDYGGTLDESNLLLPHDASMEEVVARLQAVADLDWKYAGGGLFADIYAETSVSLMQTAERWPATKPNIAALSVPFANEYLAAVQAYRQRTPISEPWRLHFAAVDSGRPVSTLLLTGMNAHILFDLPRVIAELSEGRDPEFATATTAQYEASYARFAAYSSTFGQAVRPILRALESYPNNDTEHFVSFAETLSGPVAGAATLGIREMRHSAFCTSRTLLADRNNTLDSRLAQDVATLNEQLVAVAAQPWTIRYPAMVAAEAYSIAALEYRFCN